MKAVYAADVVLLVNMPAQAKSRGQATGGIVLNTNANKTKFVF